MVAIVLAAFCEGVPICLIPNSVEKPTSCPVTGNTFPFEIAGVPGNGRCPIFDALVPDDAHLDDDAPIGRLTGTSCDRYPASPKARRDGASAVIAMSANTTPALVGGANDLSDKGLCLPPLYPAVAWTSRPDLKLIVASAHRARNPVPR
uniref:hypothetical protein n=1 Tax=Sphingopyxis indica TaxID=436663 RepID=UPI002938EC7A|nr:hypothetical protein [Sphingopyxis indica]